MYKKNRILFCISILLAVTGLQSCDDSSSNAPSTIYAFFDAEIQSISAGESIQFQDLSVGYPEEWQWTFDGGTPETSSEQNPMVTYDAPGRYDVTLTVAAEGGSSIRTEEGFVLVVSEEFLSDHIVASYLFEGSAEDAGPNSIHATNIDGVTFDGMDRRGNENSAAMFNGSNALIVPDDPALNFGTSDFSVSVWVKTDQTHKMMIWQESGAGGAGDNQAWLRIGDNTTDRLIRFATEDSGGGNILNYGNGPSSGVSDGDWHHVVCVREGSITRLYMNGEKRGELSRSSVKDVSSEQDFKIGTQEGPEGNYHTYFTGLLDDLIIYDKALTDQEVSDLSKL